MPVCDWLQSIEDAAEFSNICIKKKMSMLKLKTEACSFLLSFPKAYDAHCDASGNYSGQIKNGMANLKIDYGEICPKTCSICTTTTTYTPAPTLPPTPAPTLLPTPCECCDLDDLCEAIAVGDKLISVCDWLQSIEDAVEFSNKCNKQEFKTFKIKTEACSYLESFPKAYEAHCDASGNYSGQIKKGMAYLNIGYGEICPKTCSVCN